MTVVGAETSATATSRRELILFAATRLFAEQGYGATSIEEIGQAAGITGTGVYSHFADKEAVLEEILRRAADETVQRVASIVADADSPRGALEGLVANLVRAASDNRMALRVVLNESAHLLSTPTFRAWYERVHRLHMAEWLSLLTQLRPELNEVQMLVLVHTAVATVLTTVTELPPDQEPVADLVERLTITVLLGD